METMSESARRVTSVRRVTVVAWLLVACASSATTAPPTPPPDGPTFDNTPPPTADHNRRWAFDVQVSDPEGDPVTVSVARKPDWMAWDEARLRLSGIAGWDNVGTHLLRLTASDGEHETSRTFTITVVKGEIVCDQDFGDPSESEYVLPFPVGRSYEIIQGYCPSNPAWGHHDWFAYDFDLVTGDTVVASRAGTAWFVREDQPDVGGNCSGGKENIVFVQHDDGTIMSYAHLTTNGALVSTGDRIEQGQPIGLSGNSGCSSGPHLHVSLHRGPDDLGRKGSLPFNYRNAEGPLDQNRGLIHGATYGAVSN